ncbi:MAG: DJ-1/PfpI family protein, partial [Flavobacteriales bacterium]
MMKKILIGLVSVLVLAFIVIYYMAQPKLEEDGSYSPSSLALSLGTVSKTDFEDIKYTKYEGDKSKVLVIFTEEKNLEMKNGKLFSTGNHPIEALVPMLHLKNAGFDFEIATPSGKPVVFEMWAFPEEDANVTAIYNEYKSRFEKPKKLTEFIANSFTNDSSYAAVFIPGGHGAMIGLPADKNVGKVLNWAYQSDLFTITLCHGPGVLLSTALDNQKFLYDGYKMAVFPDAVDEMTPVVGYLPGHMKKGVSERLKNLGVTIVNTESDKTVC